MKWRWALLALGAFLVFWIGSIAGWWQSDIEPAPQGDVSFTLTEISSGYDAPVQLIWRLGEMWVLEQGGTIDGPDGIKLDLSGRVLHSGERGLLAATFNPSGERLYVHYSDRDGDTVISWFPMQGADVVDEETVILRVAQPYSNHNGGTIAFGLDGMLFAGLGDGGAAGDPQDHGQDPHTLLGTILRLDVSGETYTVPPDNPFADGEDGAPEVWAFGVRNPWRFHIDATTGDLWVGDVGQFNVEEMTRIPAGEGGHNLGWNHWEGTQPFGTTLDRTEHTAPDAEYDHDGGHCSITGGPVLRGSAWQALGLEGAVLFGDYCSGTIWTYQPSSGALHRALETKARISSFAQDGEDVYVIDHAGTVYQLGQTD